MTRKRTEMPFEFFRKKIPPNLPLNFDCVIPVKLVLEILNRGTGIQVWFLKKDMDSCFRRNDKLCRGAPLWAPELGNPFVNGRPQRAAPTAFEHLFFTDFYSPSIFGRGSYNLDPLQGFWDRPLSVRSRSHRLPTGVLIEGGSRLLHSSQQMQRHLKPTYL